MTETKLLDFDVTMWGPNGGVTDYSDFECEVPQVLEGIEEVIRDLKEMLMKCISKGERIIIEIKTEKIEA